MGLNGIQPSNGSVGRMSRFQRVEEPRAGPCFQYPLTLLTSSGPIVTEDTHLRAPNGDTLSTD